MRITTQRLRNLTTGKIHTKMEHIYEDLGAIVGDNGLMTHMLPNVHAAVLPWLKQHVGQFSDLWDNQYDPNAPGSYELPDPTPEEQADMLDRYHKMANPFGV